ncbi:PRA1 family protein B1-like [Impatiens glandulifera]|uniref:PRA1 family protein B1-like n=1 Tax=Impatiens glandulifera TaxID=253017 RepID=UPI001FB1453E|nr:PRA1 family protein B1-like [Impatiens glandulifera]
MASQPSPPPPLSNPNPLPATQSQPPPPFRIFISHITDTVRNGFSQRRPWSEIVDRSAFSKPDSLSDATSRIRKNYTYFRVNYISIVALVLGISLLTNPLALILLVGLLAGWVFLYLFRPSDQPVVIFGRTFSDKETIGMLIVASVVVVFLTSVGSVLITALLIGVGVVFVHGSFRVPEDLFMDDQEQPPMGFLSSFIGSSGGVGGGAASTPAVSARV